MQFFKSFKNEVFVFLGVSPGFSEEFLGHFGAQLRKASASKVVRSTLLFFSGFRWPYGLKIQGFTDCMIFQIFVANLKLHCIGDIQ